jgi:hypothetical protein
MKDIEKKRSEALEQIKTEKAEAYIFLEGIERCVDRMKRLMELDGPMAVVSREVEMIQYRALSALSIYECYALAKWAITSDEDKEANS